MARKSGASIHLPESERSYMIMREQSKQDLNLLRTVSLVENSYQMGRCIHQASILLIGPAGAGKSSTINHFFQNVVVATSDRTSCTAQTAEILAKSENKKLRISNLQLSVIDSPGFFDVNGGKQNARNLFSIKQFFKMHPVATTKGHYPNVVLMVLSIMENRLEGPQSRLAKTLKQVALTEVVDKANPNVIIVFTHTHSVPERKLKEKKKMLENITKKLASVYLNVSPPVVFIENDLDGLHKEGSWTILRDGTRQVRNVFDAMESILKSNKDYLGQSVITHFFQDQHAFNVLKKGFAVKLDDEDLLTKEEKLLYNTIKMQKKEKESEVDSAIKEHTSTREELVPEAMTLAIALHENGFQDRYQLRDLNTVEVANKLAPFSLNATTEILLKEIFNVDRVFLPTQDKGIGQSYKIKEDCLSQQQVYMLTEMRSSVATNDRLIPKCLKYTRCKELKYDCEVFETERCYLLERQNCLNISAPVSNSPDKFDFESLKPGHNVINSDGNIIRRFSFVLSKRLYQLQIDPTGASVNSDFLAHSRKLQTSFDKDDASHKRDFINFFKKWHHYIVTQVDCGGSLEISIDVESLSNIQDINSLIPACIEKELNLLTSKTTATTSNPHLHSKSKRNADLVLSGATVKMKGGDTRLHVTSLEELTPEKYEKWLRSLEESFEVLENGIKLQPMYLAMADMLSNGARLCIDEKTISSEKVDAVYEAQCDFLGESFRQANTRDESTSGIFNYLGNMLEGNAMTIALAGGALLLRFLLKR